MHGINHSKKTNPFYILDTKAEGVYFLLKDKEKYSNSLVQCTVGGTVGDTITLLFFLRIAILKNKITTPIISK